MGLIAVLEGKGDTAPYHNSIFGIVQLTASHVERLPLFLQEFSSRKVSNLLTDDCCVNLCSFMCPSLQALGVICFNFYAGWQ